MATSADPFDRIDRLVERADALAGAWGARARASTTVGQERAILRLFGVTGLDRDGRPLAGAAVDRWLTTAADGLGGGIALPFAMALLEYDLEPQQLAMDVASGAVDLALEAQLLRESDRRAVAEVEARRLTARAVERIDADRTARLELMDLLGEATRPWLGTTMAASELGAALDEAVRLAGAGFDVLRVEVPIGRELATRLQDAGLEAPEWRSTEGLGDVFDDEDLAPAGSQRALARLRRVADGVAAERRAYVRLATSIPPLGVPEGAVVAAFERVDLVEADPMAEIVAGGVDPDRSLADHAFARRLHRRAGTLVSIGPGPLVVAPDMAQGVPVDAPTRSGRALALQLVGVALARADGIAADRIVVGAYPAWLGDEPAGSARILAEVVIRRRLFPSHLIRFDEPTGGSAAAAAWPFVMAAIAASAGDDAILMRRTPGDARRAVADARAAGRVGSEVVGATVPGRLTGVAEEHAAAAIAAALTTLERLGDLGWRAVVGDGPGGGGGAGAGGRWALGADAVAERTDPFDPLADLD
ncbi:MAG: lysine 5,6-aminomutase subunit alpha [Chloroflexota bacterium]